ncbi:MAG TPA: T9SS type A sorting domain-containing protein [Bacteroidales bacterium]|nr:T9SS type A sorting domain-containing protein [Bacteroidales bacterium]
MKIKNNVLSVILNKSNIFILLLFFIFQNNSHKLFGQSSEECTVGVASGSATKDGRPLLWKTRDNSSSPDNEVKYNTSFKYKFIYVADAGTSTLSWMGVNEHGFAIINSASTDLVSNLTGPGNGTLMRDVLGACKTIDEFQHYLDSTNITGRSTQANFGVIDSTGAAAFFETGGNVYYKFDTDSTANGFIIRTNFSVNGGGNYGIERYNRSNVLINNFFNGDSLNYKSIIRYQMRDFSDNNSNPVSIPFAGNWSIGIPYGYIYCEKSICRTSSVSTSVIHGVLPSEKPVLTTMWTILGQPASTVALPYWPVGYTPAEADGSTTSALCDKANEIRTTLFDYSSNDNYIDTYKLRDSVGGGLWHCIFPLEDNIFSETENFLDSLRLLSSLPVNLMLNKESALASYALNELNNCFSSLSAVNNIRNDIASIQLYPNPAKDFIFIDIKNSAEIKNYSVRIINNIGSLVYENKFSQAEIKINTDHFGKTGMYLIQVYDEKSDLLKASKILIIE